MGVLVWIRPGRPTGGARTTPAGHFGIRDRLDVEKARGPRRRTLHDSITMGWAN